MVMWAGRFKKEIDKRTNDFNSSISFDKRMYKQDITGSIAHATMLGKCGIISKEESDKIIAELKNILSDLESGKLEFDMEAEDIHMFIESELTKRIGDAGKRLHTARSRNDQVALDLRLYMRDEIEEIINLLKELMEELIKKAEENYETIMPGYTHLQRAQPITLAHYFMAYAEMFKRDILRLKDANKRMNINPLGSCALAGTTYKTDRYLTSELLGFDGPCLNSLDGVSDRDYAIEIASALSILMMHMSRISEEFVMWSSHEFKFIELDDAFSTGSSIMPQKKNPDITELIRGKSGRVYGDLMALLTMMKSLPLAYDKDMQEDKEAIFDAVDNVKMCLYTFIPMLASTTFLKDNMLKAAKKGFINATDAADYLVKKGLPFRTAYKITGSIVAYAIDNDKTLDTITLDEYKKFSELFDEDIYEYIDLKKAVNDRTVVGGPAPETVREHVKLIKEFLKES